MSKYKIICPYCFKEFPDSKVHFRMETYFNENDLNDEVLTLDELYKKPDTPEYIKMKAETRNRSYFIYKDDEKYEEFWKTFGGTSETATGSDKELDCKVYQLPILNPSNSFDQNGLKELNHDADGEFRFFVYDGDGMVVGVKDIFGKETRRRVCPECHNPLPLHYGKNPVKFISIIGVTSSGKTVYISQLLRHITSYGAKAKMATNIMSSHEATFIDNNLVEMDRALPMATDEGHFEQPMFYDLLQKGDKGIIRNNIVLYDIAGETFKDANDVRKYGKFVTKSDGIIFLVDPKQLNLVPEVQTIDANPTEVLQTIHQAFVGENTNVQCKIPVAICVSKSDSFADYLIDIASQDITEIKDENGEIQPLFNATDYNQLEPVIKRLMNDSIDILMQIEYETYNYFAISATGCSVIEREEEYQGRMMTRYYLSSPPDPKRIAEPLLWLFHRFGYIKSDIPVILPHPRDGERKFVGYEKQSLLDRILGKEPIPIYRELNEDEKKALMYEPDYMAAKPFSSTGR